MAKQNSALKWPKVSVTITGAIGSVFCLIYLFQFWTDPQPRWTLVVFSGFGMFFYSLIGSCVLYSGSSWLIFFRNPILRWFGTISYAMYMFHIPIFHYAPAILPKLGIESSMVTFISTWGLIVVLPTMSWYLIEKPILALKLESK